MNCLLLVSTMIANSSPPKRPIVPLTLLSLSLQKLTSLTNTSSPDLWPKVSLTLLKLSRSI